MIFSQKLTTNSTAVVGMPMYLTVALIVAAIIIAVFTVGIYTMITASQTHHLERELGRIISEAQNMYQYADEGSCITVEVTFPSSLRYLVFGALPQPGYVEPTTFTINPQTSNNYYYVLVDGTMKNFHSPVRFSSKDTTKFAVFHAGTYMLCLELKKTAGTSYVTIYPQ